MIRIRDWFERKVADFVTRKLSDRIGRAVTFQSLRLTLSTIELSGVQVAGDDAAHPLLTIQSVGADVATGKLLTRQIVIRSLEINGPALSIIRHAGRSTNLPSRLTEAEHKTADAGPGGNEKDVDTSDDGAVAWSLEAAKINLSDGSIRYSDHSILPAYQASATAIHLELLQRANDIAVTMRVARLGRDDIPVPLAPLQMRGTFENCRDMALLPAAKLRATAEVEAMKISFATPRLDGKCANITITGSMLLARLIALLPPTLVPPLLKTAGFGGSSTIHAEIQFNPKTGLTIPQLNLSATDIRIPPVGRA